MARNHNVYVMSRALGMGHSEQVVGVMAQAFHHPAGQAAHS